MAHMKGAASKSVGNSSKAEMSQMDVSEPQLPTSLLNILKKQTNKLVGRALALGGSLLFSSISGARGCKTFFKQSSEINIGKWSVDDAKAVISLRRTPAIFGGLWTKPWPRSSGVIGNCRCKGTVNALNAITEKIHTSQ